jgi:hydroxypyruvate isomerase
MANRRREFIKSAGALGAGGILAAAPAGSRAAEAQEAPFKVKNGRIRQSVVSWCFNPMPVEDLARAAAEMGLLSVELVSPDHWPKLKALGLTCAIAGSHGFAKGFAHVEEHEECLASLRKSIDASAAFGCPSVITFSGFRRGISTEDGQRNMIAGLKKIAGYAEEKKVTLCLEMLNSRVKENMKGHPDYFCDQIEMAVEVCRAVGSPRVKMLFDIYHVQIMQGDVISRIRQFHEWIGHVHTAGNPGRNEIGPDQEINYPPIMKALLEVGYTGYVGQEFIPVSPDKIAALRDGVRICDV